MTVIEIYNRVVNLLNEQHFKFQRFDEVCEITGSFLPSNIEHIRKRETRFRLIFRDNYCVNYTWRDININVSIEQASSMLSLINTQLLCGNFQIDYDTRSVCYKNTISFTALEHCNFDELYRFISLPTAMFIEYDNKLRLLCAR